MNGSSTGSVWPPLSSSGAGIRFSISLSNDLLSPGEFVGAAGRDRWLSYAATWASAMAHPRYLKVGGRPVFKVLGPYNFLAKQCGGNTTLALSLIRRLRALAVAVGAGNPLIGGGWIGETRLLPGTPEHEIYQGIDVRRPASPFVRSSQKTRFRPFQVDYTGDYNSAARSPSLGPCGSSEIVLPFSQLADYNDGVRLWSNHSRDAVPWVPNIDASYDTRPSGNISGRCTFSPPTQTEWTAYLRKVKAKLVAPGARLGFPLDSGGVQPAVTIYAWNEYAEGGIVAPTMGEGWSKLKGIAAVFGGRAAAANALPPLPRLKSEDTENHAAEGDYSRSVVASRGRIQTVTVDFNGPPVATTPIINSWHDTAAGSAGNPKHDVVFPPSAYDIVDQLSARRSELRSPYVRLWSDTSYVYSWPASTRKTVVGPAALPPNTSHTCRTLFPSCNCCPAADCPCCAGRIAEKTSWDFAALDIQVASMQNNVAYPESTILQLTGNSPPWWFWNPNSTVGGFADPTSAGAYFSRILDHYTKGGFTDELGVYRRSGLNYTFGYLEILNEVDLNRHIYIESAGCGWHCADREKLLANVRRYIQFYDAVSIVVRANHPNIRFVGNCMAWAGEQLESLIWRTFLNRSEHAPGTPWPIDAVSYHDYAQGHVAPTEQGWDNWASTLVNSARGRVLPSTAAARAIKATSPATKIFMDEVGILLGCSGVPGQDMNDTLQSGNASAWWNIQSVVWALWIGELGAAGVDMVGASQFVSHDCPEITFLFEPAAHYC